MRDGVANVVSRLKECGLDPRKVDHDAWEARCPAHRSVDYALAIRRDPLNYVVLECRSTEKCTYSRIIGAIGLTNEQVYAETPGWLLRLLSGVETSEQTSPPIVDMNEHQDLMIPAAVPVESSATGEVDHQPVAHLGAANPGALKFPSTEASSASHDDSTDAPWPHHESSSCEAILPAPATLLRDQVPGNSFALNASTPLAHSETRDRLTRPSAIQILLRLAAKIQLFRSADGRTCAQVPVGDRLEIYGLRSAGFRDWLIDGFLADQPEPPSSGAIHRVVGMLEARARFSTSTPEVFIRVGQAAEKDGSSCFIDLGDPGGRAVAIGTQGWQVVDRPGVFFRRPEGFLPMLFPEHDGSIDLLRPYVNLSESDFRLMITWITAALRPVGPYPILVIQGEQASGKSTLAKMLRQLIDPQSCPVLALPGNVRDLMATALNGWLLVYENISAIADWFSDSICQLAFGGGFAGRTLFTNDERSVIYAQRPIILVGIDDFALRGDLRDRTVFLHLRPIARTDRQTERKFWPAFHADVPRISGGLLDAIVGGLRQLPGVHLKELPRMADFAEWGEATGRALGWGVNSFLSAYNDNRKEATSALLDDSAVASVVLTIGKRGINWSGTPLELYTALSKLAGQTAGPRWPKTIHTFGNELRRIAPQLRLHGLSILFDRSGGERKVTLKSDGFTTRPPSKAV